jgi:hypothetical protein
VAPVYCVITRTDLTTQYGGEIAEHIWTLEPGRARALRGAGSLHVVKVEAHEPARAPTFGTVRERVLTDLRNAEKRRAFDAELARITRGAAR